MNSIKTYLLAVTTLVAVFCARAQSPATITFPPTANPPIVGVDSYIRATTQINLQSTQQGSFKFGAVTNPVATNLLNLNLNSYPAYVNNNYRDPARDPNYFAANPSLPAAVTSGRYNVNSSGGFNYSIPITCSPGTAGMEPRLSISYSSGESNNWLGLGFDLAGISVITRTAKSVLYDTKNGGVSFNANDVFALDGTRLLQKTGTYGQDQSTYKTPVENYYSIKSFGSQGANNYPLYFIVTTPDGLTMEYGNTLSSRNFDNNNTEILSWYINKIYDVFGNYMTYSYTNTGGELLIDKIEYTGNGNSNPYNKIQFTYMDRSDVNSYYVGGKEFSRKHILRSVESKDLNSKTVRKYCFDYKYEYASLLSRITEVDAAGNQLNPTCFEWKKDQQSPTNFLCTLNPVVPNVATKGEYDFSIPAELNGDGLKDIILIKQNPYEAKIFLNTGQSNYCYAAPISPIGFNSTGNNIPMQGTPGQYVTSFVFDEDDDDMEEVFFVYRGFAGIFGITKLKNTNGNFALTLETTGQIPSGSQSISWGALPFYNNQGTYISKVSCLFSKEDITGDNVKDMIFVCEGVIAITPSGGNQVMFSGPTNIIKAALGDFDDDGRLDIYTIKPTATVGNYLCEVQKFDPIANTLSVIAFITINTSTSPNFNGSWTSFIPSNASRNNANGGKSIDFGDFNRDGKMDVMYVNYVNATDAKAYVLKSNGNSFLPDNNPISVVINLNGAEANYSAMDVNNDGYSDLVLTSYDAANGRTNLDHYPSNGNTLTPAVGFIAYNDKYLGALADFNGDGSLDYLFQNGFAYGSVVFNAFNQTNKKLVTHIFNIKDDLTIEYGYLPGEKFVSGGAYYVKGTPYVNTDPAFKNVKPRLVVTTQTNFNGHRFVYGYRNSVFHRQGKGFLGFEKFYALDLNNQITDPNTNLTNKLGSVTVFGYNSATDGIANTEETQGYFSGQGSFNINTAKISASQTQVFNYTQAGTNRYLNSITGSGKNYLSSTAYQQNTTFDNNNSGKLLSSSYSNIGWISQTPINTFGISYNYQTYTNPLNNASYLRVTKKIETKTANGNSSTYHTDYSFNSQSGYLLSVIKNSNIAGKGVTINFSQHNAFGLPCSLTVTTPNVPVRSSRVQYENTGRFIIASTDALNNSELALYDPAYGNVTQVTGMDGQVTTFEYDGLGRPLRSKSPTGALDEIKYEWNNYSGQLYGVKTTAKYEGNGSETTCFNRNGLPIKTESEGFGGNTIISENQYSDDNRLTSSTPPRFTTQTIYKYFNYGYDEFTRPLTVSEYNNSGTLLSTNTYAYNSLSTDATYNKGFVKLESPSGNGAGSHYKVIENNEAGQSDKIINYINVNAQHVAAYTYNQYNQPDQIVTSFPGVNGGATTTFAYDVLGRQLSINDPSSGLNQFEYNNLGELTKSTNANNQFYTYDYDVLGRLITRTGSSLGNYTYDYVTSGNGKGQLKKITGPSVVTEYLYDNYSRPIEKKESTGSGLAARQFKSNYSYDKYDRVIDYTYPSNFKTTNEYDGNGFLTKIKNGNTAIWELTGMKTPGLVENYKNTAGISTQKNYDNNLNLSQINLGNISSQGYNMANASQNVLGRTHQNFISNNNNNESFDYDDFNRLNRIDYVNMYGNTVTKDGYLYNANGTLDYKQDCGGYVYGIPGKPYVVTAAPGSGGNTSLDRLSLTMNDLNKVNKITDNAANKVCDFTYGNDEQRIKMDYSINSQLQYTRYYQDNYDRQESGNTFKEWSYIYSPTGLAAVYYNNNGAAELLNVTTDHLGSPLSLTNQAGQTVEEYSFDAWGRRRNPADWTFNNLTLPTKMIRGYTGHEQLDEIGIINMNGRVYDPLLGQFIQPDPYVQDPTNLQNMNRYSYVLNNPLNYIDPSGYSGQNPYNSVYFGGGTSIISNNGLEYYNIPAGEATSSGAPVIYFAYVGGNGSTRGGSYSGTSGASYSGNFSGSSFGGSSTSGDGSGGYGFGDYGNGVGLGGGRTIESSGPKRTPSENAGNIVWSPVETGAINALKDFAISLFSVSTYQNAFNGAVSILTDPNFMDDGDRWVGMYNNAKEFASNASLQDWSYGITYAGLSVATTKGLGSLRSVNVFGLRGGYGVFGKNGLKIGNFKFEMLYSTPTAGPRAGTIFSVKNTLGKSMARWDYGLLHGQQIEMGFHSTFRFNWFNKLYGGTKQYPAFAPFYFWKYKR